MPRYSPVPSSPSAEYHPRTRDWRRRSAVRYALIALAGLLTLVAGYALLRSPGFTVKYSLFATTPSAEAPGDRLSPAGIFFRDPTPGLTAQRFWGLAEREVAASGMDTCGDKLGRALIDAYVRKRVEYCGEQWFTLEPLNTSPGNAVSPAAALCMPVHRDPASSWWPYPAAPCVSRNLRPTATGFEARCPVSEDGAALMAEMGEERFFGKDLAGLGADAQCATRVERTVLLIHRQDQWNPFHVAEDLVTTLVTLFVAEGAVPGIARERLQLVFTDDFGMDKNHFTPLYDRMGAWAPRRLVLDPWQNGECLSNAIHSIGAGASLLSATGVGERQVRGKAISNGSDRCTSSITWAAAHYYRHLFGLVPGPPRRSINVLYLSRAKLNAFAQANGDWSAWRAYRVLTNDAELTNHLRSNLASLCTPRNGTDAECVFHDERHHPEEWAAPDPAGRPAIRFAAIDPTVHALETQVHYAGHADVILAQHGGALGLALFMRPGRGAVIEMQVNQVTSNFHFEHLAAQTGHAYEPIEIERTVNVDTVWRAVRGQVEALRAGREGGEE